MKEHDVCGFKRVDLLYGRHTLLVCLSIKDLMSKYVWSSCESPWMEQPGTCAAGALLSLSLSMGQCACTIVIVWV